MKAKPAVLLRLDAEVAKRLDDIVARYPIAGNRHAVARKAMMLGLDTIEDTPDALLRETRDTRRKTK